MGHKVNPIGWRLGVNREWSSRWFAPRKLYAKFLDEDIKIRGYIKRTLSGAAVARVDIERPGERIRVIVHTARPGMIIGRKGSEIDRLHDDLQTVIGRELEPIRIVEIKQPHLEASLVAENIAFQLVKRIAFRRAMKKAIQLSREAGAQGIQIVCQGRLGGHEMSRREVYKEGKVPLGTLRANLDYGFAEARTTYGAIGVKAWIYKGDIFRERRPREVEAKDAERPASVTAEGPTEVKMTPAADAVQPGEPHEPAIKIEGEAA